MIKRLAVCLLLLVNSGAFAQSNYAVNQIPKDMLAYASAVVRNEEITTRVISPANVIYHVKRIVTVLNSNGEDKTDLNIFYDNIRSVKYIKGTIYNEYGKAVQKISESNFEDRAAWDGVSLFDDDRVKHYTRAITDYPYTLELEYELKIHQTLSFEPWQPNAEENMSVENSTYTFICRPDYNIRYKEFNVPSKATETMGKDGEKVYTWKASDVKARRYEPMSQNDDQQLIRLIIAPEKFAYEKYTGSFTNWQQLGKWVYDDLLKNRSDIPEETAQYMRTLTTGISDPKLRARKVYEYMQQKTHYISVQIGIGGYQPFPASDVDKQGYGDCKALVNYARALLKTVGIDSWYCLVYGDPYQKRSMIADFASIQGNHAILCIPLKNDTTWLECTNQHTPFGFLGDFTDDRTVLACTPEGGKLMHTPKYPAEQNLVKRRAEFTLTETGDLAGEMETTFKGTNYDDRYSIVEKAQTERLKDFKKYYPINNIDLKLLEYKQDKSVDPAIFENVKFAARQYGAINDGKYYFSINSFDRTSSGLRQTTNRVNPVVITRGHTYEDKVIYMLPKGYQLDSEPLNISLDKPFGNYTAKMTVNGDQLIYERKLQLKDGIYPKDEYGNVVDFYQAVEDADNYNVTLVKK